jgi:hypothetical protein
MRHRRNIESKGKGATACSKEVEEDEEKDTGHKESNEMEA